MFYFVIWLASMIFLLLQFSPSNFSWNVNLPRPWFVQLCKFVYSLNLVSRPTSPCQTPTSVSSRFQNGDGELRVYAHLSDYHVYTTLNARNQFQAPTEFGLCLRPTANAVDEDTTDLRCLACESERARLCWLTAMRLAKVRPLLAIFTLRTDFSPFWLFLDIIVKKIGHLALFTLDFSVLLLMLTRFFIKI